MFLVLFLNKLFFLNNLTNFPCIVKHFLCIVIVNLIHLRQCYYVELQFHCWYYYGPQRIQNVLGFKIIPRKAIIDIQVPNSPQFLPRRQLPLQNLLGSIRIN